MDEVNIDLKEYYDALKKTKVISFGLEYCIMIAAHLLIELVETLSLTPSRNAFRIETRPCWIWMLLDPL